MVFSESDHISPVSDVLLLDPLHSPIKRQSLILCPWAWLPHELIECDVSNWVISEAQTQKMMQLPLASWESLFCSSELPYKKFSPKTVKLERPWIHTPRSNLAVLTADSQHHLPGMEWANCMPSSVKSLDSSSPRWLLTVVIWEPPVRSAQPCLPHTPDPQSHKWLF